MRLGLLVRTVADFTRFRKDGKDGRLYEPVIRRFDPPIDRRVLAFDQTLTHCGWVAFSCAKGEKVVWIDGETIEPGIPVHTMEGKFKSAHAIQHAVEGIARLYHNVDLVVLESPMVPRVGVHYSDSSVIAAAAVYCAVRNVLNDVEVRVVETTSTKLRWTENPQASKAAVRNVLQDFFPEMKKLPRLTEHVYDAAAVGLLAAESVTLVKESLSES